MKTLVLGLGNPILSDDGVGLRVAEEVKNKLNHTEIAVMKASTGGMDLLDTMAGYEKVVIVDAIQTDGGKVGQVYRLEPGALTATKHTSSPHDTSLAVALQLGRRLGMTLPQQIVIYAVEVADVTTFNEGCTPEVKQVIPAIAAMVLQELEGEMHCSEQ